MDIVRKTRRFQAIFVKGNKTNHKMKTKYTVILIGVILMNTFTVKSQNYSDTLTNYFQEIKEICDNDNGVLWGSNLWSPILFIERDSRKIYANQIDSSKQLTEYNGLYIGQFPENKIIANSTTDFGGTFWTMVALPLPDDDFDRKTLIIHEMFHRLQPSLNLNPKGGYNNNHLDSLDARVLLKLEWNALIEAVTDTANQKEHIFNALIFRNQRRELFTGCDTSENRFELYEGLPEYTAYKLVLNNKSELEKRLITQKKIFWEKTSYIRSFGYFSGFIYAFLLDQTDYNWKSELSYDSDLGEFLKNAHSIAEYNNNEHIITQIKSDYGFDSIYIAEFELYKEKQAKLLNYKKTFYEQATVHFPLINPNYGFNPNTMHTLNDLGVVFEYINLIDDWGILKVSVNSKGCLITTDWKTAIVSSNGIEISEDLIKTDNWTLELNAGFEIQKQNDGNYLINRKTP